VTNCNSQTQDQYLGRIHYPFTLFRPSICSIHHFNSILAYPFLGKILSPFCSQSLADSVWQVYTAMTGLCLVLAILFVEETYYDRRLSPQQQPHKTSRLLRLVGVEQYRSRRLRNTFLQAVMRPIKVLAKPTIFVSCVYYCLTFAWVVGM
jgi:hypothetical protein